MIIDEELIYFLNFKERIAPNIQTKIYSGFINVIGGI